MSRLDASNQSQAEANSNQLAVFLELQFPGGTVRWTDAPKALTFDSNTYTPSNRIAGIAGTHERSDLQLGPMDVYLTREAANLTAIATNYQNSLAVLYIGFLNMNTYALVADPEPYGSFFMSNDSFEDGLIVLTCESVTKGLFGGNPVYPSPQSQTVRYPGDTIFDAVQACLGLEFEWGGVSYAAGDGGGCVCVDTIMPDGRRASEVRVGDIIEMECGTAVVTYSERKIMPCVRVTTANGRVLECSTSAPLKTPHGFIKTRLLADMEILTRDGYSDVVSIEPIGPREVQHISIDNRAFWAADILHHNKLPTGIRDDPFSVNGGATKFSPGTRTGL